MSDDEPTVRAPAPRRPASAGFDHGRFLPGSMLTDRYRIVAMLGRGGMGEVYRADDLKLGQSVALKFLPRDFVSDPDRLSRFLNEVRTARQVAHPNVCRVYDVGEAGGEHFLSMEFVQGEDLATLLRRIGRLPGDKALQIARQICAGLAAAHERGVIHRDLKPANVMLDERGAARITDFGLAGAAEEFQGEAAREGTPAYMAPEQLAGRNASARSDVYSLGLLLYELFTGKPAFSADTPAEMLRLREQSTPTNPSNHVTDMDPAVERVILRCLDGDPLKRPGTAALVAAALPGGDPLTAAVAAGETPSPEMVAAAGETGAMRPAVAWACLGTILAGLALAAYLSPRAYRHGHVPLEKSPEVLAERAREIIQKLGYPGKPRDSAWGFSGNGEYRRWVEEHDRSPLRWKDMETGRPAAIYFWYRQSEAPLIPERFRGDDSGLFWVTEGDPPTTSGVVSVELDTLGRLIRFETAPSSGARTPPATFDGSILLSEAGVDAAAFSPAAPGWLPPSYADARGAWVESRPERPDRRLRIEAAAAQGRPVFFELVGPWSRPPATGRPAELIGVRQDFQLAAIAIFIAIVGCGVPIARRNLRMGRSDLRGATRLAIFVVVCSMISWAFATSHVASLSELGLLLIGASIALLLATVCWLMYIALEPLIRSRWPDSLIAWTRLLSGRFSDPLVGRVLLAGALLGVVSAISLEVRQLVLEATAATPPIPPLPWLETLRGPRYVAAHLFNPGIAMFFALLEALFFFLLRAILRKDWLAAAVFVLIESVPGFLAGGPISGAFSVVLAAAAIILFLRFGLLVWVFANYFGHFLEFPLTTDSRAWYAGTSLFVLLVLAAISVAAFRLATAGGRGAAAAPGFP